MEHQTPASVAVEVSTKDNLRSDPYVHSIPPEILSTIFADLQPRRRSRYRIPFEVAISHVCSRWREAALDTPLLWRNIDAYSPLSLDCVSKYLQRSRTCPIDIRLDIWQRDRDLDPEDGATIFAPLVDLIVRHASQWRTLLVFASRKSTTNAILARMKDLEVPLLERMRIVDDDSAGEFNQTKFFPLNPRILIGGAPNLVSLHTNNLGHPPPLTSLTALHLCTTRCFSSDDINSHILLDLIQVCPSLSTLSIHGNFTGNWRVENVTMPSLRSLWFEGTDTLGAKFLTTVNLPNLEALWLDCPHYQSVNMIYDHRPWPSFPSLKYLTLQHFDYFASTKYSQIFPSIEALYLSYCNSFHITFLKQAAIEDDITHWRNLHTLAFRTTRDSHASKFSQNLSEMVAERRLGNRPIRRVLVDNDLLNALTMTYSIRTHTTLEELRADNYDDPWWIMLHEDTADRL